MHPRIMKILTLMPCSDRLNSSTFLGIKMLPDERRFSNVACSSIIDRIFIVSCMESDCTQVNLLDSKIPTFQNQLYSRFSATFFILILFCSDITAVTGHLSL